MISNSGVSERTLSQLRALVEVLNSVASGGMLFPVCVVGCKLSYWTDHALSPVLNTFEGETEILERIIRLDIAKNRYYLKDIRTAKDVLAEHVSAVELRIIEASSSASHVTHPALQQFREWLEELFTIRDMPPDPEPETLVPHIRWAQKAKKYYLEFLKIAFLTKVQPLPRWVRMILKLGRYGIASRAFVQLAAEFPGLLNPLVVEAVQAPLKTLFTISEVEMPLTCVLRRAVGGRVEEYLPRLASVWGIADAELHFRRACLLDLAVHAEIQLVNFCEHNKECKPSLRFIGVS